MSNVNYVSHENLEYFKGKIEALIPTETTVSNWGFTKNEGTITGIKMNGASKGTSGVVDLGTVITSLSGYATETWVGEQGYITGITSTMVTDALGYTPPTVDTWRPLGTGSTDACAGNDARLSDSRPANGGSANFINDTARATQTTKLQYSRYSGATDNPSNAWYSHLITYGSTNWWQELALGINDDSVYFRRNDNGSIQNWKRLAFASEIPSVSGNSGTGGPVWGNLVPVKVDGVMEVGKYIDFHNASNDGLDYSCRLQVQGNNSNTVYLPTAGGTLALTSELPNISGKLDKVTDGGIPNGSISGGGSYPSCKLGTFNVHFAWANYPIILEITGRGFLATVKVVFQNTGESDPGITRFSSNSYTGFYLVRTSAGIWDLYCTYTESWGSCVIARVYGAGAGYFTASSSNVSSIPSGAVQCTLEIPTKTSQLTNDSGYITDTVGGLTLTGTGPLSFTGSGSGAYDRGAIYVSQSDGITLETPRASNSESAAAKSFYVKTRGGQYTSLYAGSVYSNNKACTYVTGWDGTTLSLGA